jgi:hypothetical protein
MFFIYITFNLIIVIILLKHFRNPALNQVHLKSKIA